MNNQIKTAILNQYGKNLALLYGEAKVDRQAERYATLLEKHYEQYGVRPIFVSSPGRIEIVGNHTDHNHGKVLASAINLDTLACVTKAEDTKVTVCSEGFEPVVVDSADLTMIEEEKGRSHAIVKGVLKYLSDLGYKIGGFNATTTSEVPKAAGVSSSASFEVLIAKIVSILFNEGKVTPIEQAYAAHYAEREYFGKPCGLLDQMSIAFGGVTYMDFENPEAPVVEKIPADLTGYNLVLISTGGNHSDLTDHYASIGEEMRMVANHFGCKVLRDLDEEKFYEALPKIANKLPARAIMRAMHFYEENMRVDSAAFALRDADIEEFALAINESGESSYKKLQNCYVPGDLDQRIPLALAITRTVEGVLATRVHGGGFMGTILTLVDSEVTDEYVKTVTKVFGKENVHVLELRNYGATKV